jgi:hypothetical protein
VRLSPLGTSATNWLIVPAPDDRWWVRNSRGMRIGRENQSTWRKPYPTLCDLGSNQCRRGGKAATNRLNTTLIPCLFHKHCNSFKSHSSLCQQMAVNFRGGLPVVILLEGEGFVSGLVSRFPGQDLAAEGVIVVSVSYRLNVFGKSKWP